jgi:hypothetical protein
LAARQVSAVLAQSPSSAPVPAYRQHHDVAAPQVDAHAFRQGWRVTARLDALLESGRITREAWDAACIWRRWVETVAPSHVQRWDTHIDASLAPNDAWMLMSVNAAAKLRQASDALGALRVKILESVVVKDLAWVELARFMRVSDKTARDRAVESVNALADWHAGRSVPPAPAIRFRNQPGAL